MDREQFDKLVQKIEEAKGKSGVDLNAAEDLSLAVMNLISLEEHFYFTGEKTGNGDYFDLSAEIREMRKVLLKKLVDTHEGETWCASKHLLSATMRLIEVGNRYQGEEGRKDEAKAYFDQAFKVYSIFWALRLKLISVKQVEGAPDANADGKLTLEDIVSKLADCCKE